MDTLAIRSIKAGMAYFALVFGAGFVLGALRVPFLVPRLGERMALPGFPETRLCEEAPQYLDDILGP